MNERERHSLIFDLIGQGKNADEISQIIDCGNTLSKEYRRGDQSEAIAEYRLRKLYIVRNTIRYPRYSQQDSQGYDIKVSFHRKEFTRLLSTRPSIRSCHVQVKSSNSGLMYFKRKFGENKEQREINLARKQIALVNARWEEDYFHNEFIRQTTFINDFHKNNN